MQYKFITIEGNIGAGKTTLAHLLATKLNAKLVLEEFSDNPFLPKFYANPTQYAFPLELFFMAERFKQLKDVLHTNLFQQVTISDYLFVKCLLFAKVNLTEEEYKLYQKLFEIIHQQIVYPDILIYLHAPVSKLQQNIKKRSRSYEQKIPDNYLQNIQEAYLQYLRQQKVPTLLVDASNADFTDNESHLQIILEALKHPYKTGIHRISLS